MSSLEQQLLRRAKEASDFRLAAKSESNNNWAANNIKNAGRDPGGYSFGGIQFNEQNTLKFVNQLPDELKKKIPMSIRQKKQGLTRQEANVVGKFFEDEMTANPEQFKGLQEDYATQLTSKVRANAKKFYGEDYESLPQNVQEFITSVGVNMNWEGNQKFIMEEPLKRLKSGASPEDVIGEMALRRSVAIGRAPGVDSEMRKSMVTHRTVEELSGEMNEPTEVPFESAAVPFNERVKQVINSPSGRSKLNNILKQSNKRGASMQEINDMVMGEVE